MLWFIQLIIAVNMIILYIGISKGLRTNSNFLYKRLVCSFGIGLFSVLLLIFWIHQYSVHHTIIYWRIVYLIREKRSYLHNPECVGQVIRRKITQYNVAGESFPLLVI